MERIGLVVSCGLGSISLLALIEHIHDARVKYGHWQRHRSPMGCLLQVPSFCTPRHHMIRLLDFKQPPQHWHGRWTLRFEGNSARQTMFQTVIIEWHICCDDGWLHSLTRNSHEFFERRGKSCCLRQGSRTPYDVVPRTSLGARWISTRPRSDV